MLEHDTEIQGRVLHASSVRQRAPWPTGARLSRFVARAAKSAVRGWSGCGCSSARPGPMGVGSRWRGAPPGGRCWPSCAGWSATAGRRGLQRGPGAVAQRGGRAGGGCAPFHDCGQQRQPVEGDGAGGAPPHGRSLGSWPSGTRAGGVPIPHRHLPPPPLRSRRPTQPSTYAGPRWWTGYARAAGWCSPSR